MDAYATFGRYECSNPAPITCVCCGGEAEGNYSFDNGGALCDKCEKESAV